MLEYTILFVAIAVLTLLILLYRRLGNQKPSQEMLNIFKILQEASQEDRKVLIATLQQNTSSLNQRLDNAAKIIGDVQKNIGEMSEIGRGMKELQEFLRSPKLRGNMGEHILNELLAQMLPKQSFHLQYTFKSGEKVDAAIKTAAGIIPIDSKFPMENFRKMNETEGESDAKLYKRQYERDVRSHIDAISKKYIVTEEGTIDYALMYVPSEAVYYDVVNNADLFDYASGKRVLPVSPTTFYAYLRAILMSFEGQKLESETKKLFSLLRAVQKDYTKTLDSFGTLSRHISNAYNTTSSMSTLLSDLGEKLQKTQELGSTEENVKRIKASED